MTAFDARARAGRSVSTPTKPSALPRTVKRGMCYNVPCPGPYADDGQNKPFCHPPPEQQNRYELNINHQIAELVYPLLDAIVAADVAPQAVVWRFTCLPLTRWMLEATLPSTTVLCGTEHALPAYCNETTRIRPRGTGGDSFPLARTRSAVAVRSALYRNYSIGLRSHRAKGLLSATVLQREHQGNGSAGHQGNSSAGCTGRGLSANALTAVVAKLGRHLDNVVVDTIPSRGAAPPGSLCTQVSRFARADLLLSVHGAHLSLLPALQPDSVFVEVTPWASSSAPHYSQLVRHLESVRRFQVCAKGPPAGFWETANETRCAASSCRSRVMNCLIDLQGAAAGAGGGAMETCHNIDWVLDTASAHLVASHREQHHA